MYTTHGHHIAGTSVEDPPDARVRCGGPVVCNVCSREASQIQSTEPRVDKPISEVSYAECLHLGLHFPEMHPGVLERWCDTCGMNADGDRPKTREQVLNGFNQPPKPPATDEDRILHAKTVVVDFHNEAYDMADKIDITRVQLVWFSKVLQNWKALVTQVPTNGQYYEVSYNGDKRETYLDVYVKMANICRTDPIPLYRRSTK